MWGFIILISTHVFLMQIEISNGVYVGEVERSGTCTYQFQVWSPDGNLMNTIQNLETKVSNVSLYNENKILRLVNEMEILKYSLSNATSTMENQILRFKNENLETELYLKDLKLELEAKFENISSYLNHAHTSADLSNPETQSHVISQLKNVVSNLKGEWFVIKRDLRRLNALTAQLESLVENMTRDTSTLKISIDELKIMTFALQGEMSSIRDSLPNDLASVGQNGQANVYSDESQTPNDNTLEDIVRLRGKLHTLSLRVDKLEFEHGPIINRRSTTQHPLVEISFDENDVDGKANRFPIDCQDIYNQGYRTSGVYQIKPINASQLNNAYCEMINGTGWTMLQRREDGSTDFDRSWDDYKYGFGKIYSGFWIGNQMMHHLTQQRNYTLRVDMWDWQGRRYFAEYRLFSVASEDDKYRLEVNNYSGNAGDSLSSHNGLAFSSRDRDNDLLITSCAEENKSGWWFNSCRLCNLNGVYRPGSDQETSDGIVWYSLRNSNFYSLKRVEMKIKRQA